MELAKRLEAVEQKCSLMEIADYERGKELTSIRNHLKEREGVEVTGLHHDIGRLYMFVRCLESKVWGTIPAWHDGMTKYKKHDTGMTAIGNDEMLPGSIPSQVHSLTKRLEALEAANENENTSEEMMPL